MKSLLNKIFNSLVTIFGKNRIESLLIFGLKSIDSNLYDHSLIQQGFSGWSDYEYTGELDTLKLLRNYLGTDAIFFDIGANDGSYSTLIQQIFPDAKIYAFEPVKSTFDLASQKLSNQPNIKLYYKAVSNIDGVLKLYLDITNKNNQVSSSYADGLKDFYSVKEISSIEVESVKIETFCSENTIQHIDFLKIDVEGAELKVLEGSKSLIEKEKIKFVQFEFNDFNVSSRTFIKDFYNILPNYRFYRIRKNGFYPLGEYDTSLEIFKYQNILAVHNSLNFDV